MELALAAFSLAPGLAVGSFLNVVAARVPRRRSVVKPASACLNCGTELEWRDNVPVISWLLLRGRCRSCGTRISALYPAVELATALLVAACVLAFGLSARMVVAAAFCAVLVAVSAIDLTHRIIPNRIVVPAAAIALAAQTVLSPSPQWALGALGASGFLFLAVLAYPAGMGMGDVKLALLMGAALGKTVGVALMLGMLLALVPAIFLLARHGSKARKMGIPFGPFLALGSVVALFFGGQLLDSYLALMS
ncbi:MAG: prepilin peptidase [Actinobacteria bacterium]|nr:prepilin peptidase [Actinomycetota bacterium]